MSFETFLTDEQTRPTKGRRFTHAMSLLLHGGALGLALAVSYWHVEELAAPEIPLVIATGPMVPPPPAKGRPEPPRNRRPPTVAKPRPREILQPIEEPLPEEEDGPPGDRKGEQPGQPGGHEGGDGPPAPAPAPQGIFVPPVVARGRLAIDPNDDRYAARLPAAMARVGASLWALLKVCVRPDGVVSEVKLIRGADPSVDPLIIAAIQRWRYHPYTVDGRPVPFCTNLRYEISTSR
jgi:hypothetical protein